MSWVVYDLLKQAPQRTSCVDLTCELMIRDRSVPVFQSWVPMQRAGGTSPARLTGSPASPAALSQRVAA